MECDILVVGAGPAGASAARTAASLGLKVLCIDKKKKFGVPVQCAEGIGSYLLPKIPFKIPKRLLIWRIDGLKFEGEGKVIKVKGREWSGYAINRVIFENWLIKSAIKKGAMVENNSELLDLKYDHDFLVKEAEIRIRNVRKYVKPKIVIAADGAESTVMGILGLNEAKYKDYVDVYSWEMRNLKLNEPHFEQIYVGDFAPRAYAYIFPKSKRIANVGVGSRGKKAEEFWGEFLEVRSVNEQLRDAEYVIEKSKKAVFNFNSDRWIYGNVVFVGDSVCHNIRPFVEGFLPAIICGDVAARLVKSGDVSNQIYHKNINKVLPLRDSSFKAEIVNEISNLKGKKKHLIMLGFLSGALKNPRKFYNASEECILHELWK